MDKEFVDTREATERLKDILSVEIGSTIFDWHIADELNIPYNSFRMSIMKNRLPLKQIAIFCYKRDIQINTIIF